MSATVAAAANTAWLRSKLKQFELDEDIYLNYIESVVAGEEDRCEKIGALEAILSDVLVSILHWHACYNRLAVDRDGICNDPSRINTLFLMNTLIKQHFSNRDNRARMM